MKRKISAILIISIILSMFSVFGINTFADAEYERLMEESKKYTDRSVGSYFPLYAPSLAVLLYTDAAKKFTIEKKSTNGEYLFRCDLTWFLIGEDESGIADYYLECAEITQATQACRTHPDEETESRSALRECIKYFDISKEELLTAFKRMEEDPDYIRPLLSFLTDEEFEKSKGPNGTFGRTDWPEFVIEAMYMEDDAQAHDLLTYRNVVYIPELGRVTTDTEIVRGEKYFITGELPDDSEYLSIDDLIKFDLTSDSMGRFIECLRKQVANSSEVKLITEERMAMLEAAREYQLANPPQTGEAVYLIPVALVSLALGALVIYPRRRKIDNI